MPNEALDPLLNARDRLFRVLFFKISLLYARTLSPSVRTLIEFGILTKVIHTDILINVSFSSFHHYVLGVNQTRLQLL
jgi:hypothetical protein